MSGWCNCTSRDGHKIVLSIIIIRMKNLIVFLLLIAVAVTAYVLLDDYFQANEDSFNNMQYEQSIIKTPSKLQNMPTSTGVISTGIATTTSIISTFTANGTEPFWAADFSGTTSMTRDIWIKSYVDWCW